MKLLLATIVLLAGSVQAHAQQVLHVYGWKDYLEPGVLEDFQKQTGIAVDYQSYTSNDELRQALGAGSRYDLVMPSHFMLKQLIDEKRLAPLDTHQLAHYADLDPWLLSILAGLPGANQHAVPYLWGSTGLVISPALAQASYGGPLPNSWRLLFAPAELAKLSSCGVAMLDAADEVSSLLLNYRGRRLSRTTDRQLGKQLETLKPVMPLVQQMNNWDFVDGLVDGRLCLAMAWSGHAVRAMQGNPKLTYSIPEEGAAIIVDTLAIPSDAANPKLAYRLIDFLISPPVAIRNALNSHFYPPLPNDTQTMQAFAKANPGQVLTTDQRRRSYLLETVPAAQRKTLDEAWSGLEAVRK
ncbi:extracellular solute-binding protein [Pseudomonas sp. NCHU5208]|uniref:extracellular solute-binding protein n=1 Tax=unclassified Pseudomonas TaxID=196821 RepID=UPI003F9BA1C1